MRGATMNIPIINKTFKTNAGGDGCYFILAQLETLDEKPIILRMKDFSHKALYEEIFCECLVQERAVYKDKQKIIKILASGNVYKRRGKEQSFYFFSKKWTHEAEDAIKVIMSSHCHQYVCNFFTGHFPYVFRVEDDMDKTPDYSLSFEHD